ncbi:MAG: hypothetical protein SH868_04925 [Bythopirellula sp.]|nr:hypothetical protein [Bythopirellula sp.]
MKTLFSIRWLLSCCLVLVGCGSAVESDGDAQELPVGTTGANVVDVAPPTAEQIARWTPSPFEPVELLAIHEWEKTSFTSCLAGLPDGKHFIVAGSRVVLWSVAGEEPEHVFLELTSEDGDRNQEALEVSPDGTWFAVGDSTGTLRIWNLADKSEVITKQLYTNDIQDLAISRDGAEIATISYDKEITIWSAPGLEEKKKFEVTTQFLKRLEYVAPQVLAAAGETTSTWNTNTGAVIEELSPGRYGHALARSPDGTTLIFGGDEKLVIWDIKAGKPEGEITRGVSGSEQVVFSPNGKFLATNSGGTIQLWNLAERRVVQVINSFGWPMVGVCWLPETNLIAIASDIGVTRIWGTAQQGEVVGLKPLHVPPKEFAVPATPDQMREVINMSLLPRLPGSEIHIATRDLLSGLIPGSVADAKTFYSYILKQAGWSDPVSPEGNPHIFEFRKDGFRLNASFSDAGDGKTSVDLNHDGNFDLRDVPKFAGAPTESAYEAANTVSYRTKADLLTIETNLLRTLPKAGWSAYSRLNTSRSEEPDARDIEFVKNGVSLRVSIGKFPVAPDSYTIQYSLFPNNASVPVPPDAGYVEFDGSTDPKLIATTKMSLDEAREFYDKELAKEGWLGRGRGHTMKDEYAWLYFLRGQNDLTLGLTKLPDGRTLVRVGEASGSLWEGSQPKEEEEDVEEAETEVVGIEAADFPILNATQTAKFDTVDKTIEVLIENSTLAAAAEKYTKAIEALGWKHDGRGIRDEQYTFLTYEKGDTDFSLRAHPKEGHALVNFGGDGLLWTKPLPVEKEVVSFERWLLVNKLPPGLDLLDRYEAEMRGVGKP